MSNKLATVLKGYASKNPTRSNANLNYNLSGLCYHLYSEYLKEWSLKLYSQLGFGDIARAHINGDMHIHNLLHAFLCGYCAGWNPASVLTKGLILGDIESKPAKHFDVAIDHLINFVCSATQEWSGAMAFGDFDVKLAPYVREDKLNFKQVRQQIQRAIWNFNYPSRFGGQSPFVNWTLHLRVPRHLKGEPALVGTETRDVYDEYSNEIIMIDRAIFEVLLNGDKLGRPFTFPIPSVSVGKDLDWESDIVKKLMELTAKKGSPYFLNYVHPLYNDTESLSMCCRLKLDLTKLMKSHQGGIWSVGDSTGSIGVVTINMGRLGKSRTEDELFDRLLRLMNLARVQLKLKRQTINTRLKEGLLPITEKYLGTFDFHFSTIGFIGMHEMCMNFLKEPIFSKEGSDFVIRLLKYMNFTLEKFAEEDNILYNLEATPAEETASRFARLDKIKKGYYTNSYRCPPDANLSLFDRIDVESQFHPLTTGGTVFHTYLGDEANPSSLSAFIRKVLTKRPVAYLSITPTLVVCPSCGHSEVGTRRECVMCNTVNETWSRIVGYYRPVEKWNEGKKKEFEHRRHYAIRKLGNQD